MITNEQLQAVLGSRTISYKAIFAKAIGNVNAAVFLSQGLFWQEEAKYKTNVIIEGKKFFAKTIPEWWDETGLTEDQQRTARAALLRCGILEEIRAGVPATLHYRFDLEALVAVVSRYLNTGEPVAGSSGNWKPGTPRTSSGKFRQLEAGNTGNYIIESIESIEEEKERTRVPAQNASSSSSEIPKKEEPSLRVKKSVEQARPAPRSEFSLFQPLTPDQIRADAEEMKADPEFRRVLEVNYRVPGDRQIECIAAFAEETIALKTKYNNITELRRHCMRWCTRGQQIQNDEKKKAAQERGPISQQIQTI